MQEKQRDQLDAPDQAAEQAQETDKKASAKKHTKASKNTADQASATDKQESKTTQKSELELLQDAYDALNDRFLRTVAEYDNYRKRTEREKLASATNGCCCAVEQILPVLDTLDNAAEAETQDAEYKKGVVMTLDLFKNALSLLGIEEIQAQGVPFDPELHYAVGREQKEGVDSGTITVVMQKGYKMGDRVIRYAMVMVAE